MHSRDVLPPGTVLDGKYRIERLIGSGGFGMTYAAQDFGLGQTVAVKEYYPAQFGTREGTLTVRPASARDQDLFDRLKDSFLREAKTLAQFKHPSIVRVLSVFEGHGTAYMIMEFESGRSLRGWLDDLGRRPTQAELDRIVVPVLDALETMHEAHFLHRDIAPDNIIVRANGSPVLLDFGAARRVMAELSGALTGIVKQGYSPQEQYANDPRAQGPWSDIYALGATLYRCVAGTTPPEATLRMLDDATEPATTFAEHGYRLGFLSAIDQAMAVRPRERPQTIAAFRKLLVAPDAPVTALTETASVQAEAISATATARETNRTALPGADGWSRISPPPKSRIAERYADASQPARVAIAALALVAASGVVWAMVDFASNRVLPAKDTQIVGTTTRSEQRAEDAKAFLDRNRLEAQPFQKAAEEKERQRQADADAAARRADTQRLASEEAARQAKREQDARNAAAAKAPLSAVTGNPVPPLARPKTILKQVAKVKAAADTKLLSGNMLTMPAFADKVPNNIREPNTILIGLPNGFMALAKDGVTVRFYGDAWQVVRTVSLDGVFDRGAVRDGSLDFRRSIEDIAAAGDTIFINVGCARTYAKVFKGDCAFLMAIDANTRAVQWKSPGTVSSGTFYLSDDIILSSYGFTDEPDYVFAIDASTGKVLQRVLIDSQAELELFGTTLKALSYNEFLYTFEVAPRSK